jgi:hypothetical protein
MQCNVMKWNAMQCNVMQCNAIIDRFSPDMYLISEAVLISFSGIGKAKQIA